MRDGDPVSSAAKMLRVLAAFAPERPRMTAEALAGQAGLPLSSTYRYLATLRRTGLLDEDRRGGFHLSAAVISLGEAARAALPMTSIARPIMDQLAERTGEAVILLRRSGDRAICVERSDSLHPVRMTFEVGTAVPLYRGAGPKLLLAHMPDPEMRAVLSGPGLCEAGTSPDEEALEAELAAIRARGWAESHAELQFDVYAAAAPVRQAGEVIAALSVVGPAYRVPAAVRPDLVEAARQTAAEITARLAGS